MGTFDWWRCLEVAVAIAAALAAWVAAIAAVFTLAYMVWKGL
jgi:hypothetical protein